ncbi:hypothetical protein [Mogibacterium pumilum]|nr:hypothetical protein [Mogibacterium pumilum]
MAREYAHAYILEGRSDESRDEYIRSFVKDIICPNTHVSGHACGICPACIRVNGGTHEDLFFMNQSGKETYKTVDAAAMIERLGMRPYGERNVGVIDNAERLSEIVQNKLLKTLEEPYPGTVIILATDNKESLLPTVRSRCVELRVNEETQDSSNSDSVEALMKEWLGKTYFFKIRDIVKKNFKSNEEAFKFLDALEENLHERLLGGGNLPQDAEALLQMIDQVEDTRINIKRGMTPDYALNSLFLNKNNR